GISDFVGGVSTGTAGSFNPPIAWDGTGPKLVGVLSDAAVVCAANSQDRVLPTTVWMGLDVFGQITGLADAEGRPLLPNIGPSNAIGTADAVSLGSLRGLNVVIDPDPNMNGKMVVGNPRYAEWYETAGAPIRLQVTEVSILGYNIGVAGMFAFLLTDPKAFVAINATITTLAGLALAENSTSSKSK